MLKCPRQIHHTQGARKGIYQGKVWGKVSAEPLHATVPHHQHNEARTRKRPPPCGSGTAATRARQTINPTRVLMTKALKNFTWRRREVGRHFRTVRGLEEDWPLHVGAAQAWNCVRGEQGEHSPFPSSRLPLLHPSHGSRFLLRWVREVPLTRPSLLHTVSWTRLDMLAFHRECDSLRPSVSCRNN